MFEQKYDKYQSFLSQNFQFLEVKFSLYLNRLVFVMLVFKNLNIFAFSHSKNECKLCRNLKGNYVTWRQIFNKFRLFIFSEIFKILL